MESKEAIIERHIQLLTQLARVSNCGISLFDNHTRRHVFTSFNFEGLFGYDLNMVARHDTDYINTFIHPDDISVLERNGRATQRFFNQLDTQERKAHTKFVSEYRMRRSDGGWMRVIEQFQPLELDERGEVWLSLSVLDLSPNQGPLAGVQSRLIDCRTGRTYQLPQYCDPSPATLSGRERDILRMVRDGLLSKEISGRLDISVHTVNTHRQRILEKLGVGNSMEAVQYASRYGLID